MYLVAIAWFYVALLMAAAEATSPQGTILGACITFILYGLLPLSIVLYVMGAKHRRRARQRQASEDQTACDSTEVRTSDQRDAGDHAAGEPLAPVREKP